MSDVDLLCLEVKPNRKPSELEIPPPLKHRAILPAHPINETGELIWADAGPLTRAAYPLICPFVRDVICGGIYTERSVNLRHLPLEIIQVSG